jgi:hypothetical protein
VSSSYSFSFSDGLPESGRRLLLKLAWVCQLKIPEGASLLWEVMKLVSGGLHRGCVNRFDQAIHPYSDFYSMNLVYHDFYQKERKHIWEKKLKTAAQRSLFFSLYEKGQAGGRGFAGKRKSLLQKGEILQQTLLGALLPGGG